MVLVADEVGKGGSWSANAGVMTACWATVQCYLQKEMVSGEFSP
ncbi:hypothetical protein [Klebsiella pneumoniae ISC21]|nr:hypothetical protein [Klebsiella pneumoniae ISC21]